MSRRPASPPPAPAERGNCGAPHPGRRRLLARAGLLALGCAVSGMAGLLPAAHASLPELLRRADNWQRWGHGEFTWFGLTIYRATLWVAGDDPQRSPHALKLEYERAIPAERLVRSSIDEMRRLGAGEAALARWQLQLRQVFPDVRKGDVITGVHVPGVGARFYHQDRHQGDIEDPEFAARFFAIWLDPRSRDPELRASLLRRPADS